MLNIYYHSTAALIPNQHGSCPATQCPLLHRRYQLLLVHATASRDLLTIPTKTTITITTTISGLKSFPTQLQPTRLHHHRPRLHAPWRPKSVETGVGSLIRILRRARVLKQHRRRVRNQARVRAQRRRNRPLRRSRPQHQSRV